MDQTQLPQHALDRVTQQEADFLQEQRGWVDPAALERRVAHRVASMSEKELQELSETGIRAAWREIARSFGSAIRILRGVE